MKRDFAVIFDLDGTLIDSQASILGSIKTTLEEMNIRNVIPLAESLIGPPLMETLAALCGTQKSDELSRIASKFKEIYDREGFKQSIPYEGTNQLLETLSNEGYTICLVTNKRHIPTIKILSHFNWERHFSHIYAIDSLGAPFKNKTETISMFLHESAVDPRQSVYVGDRYEDYEAAKNNDMQTILVDWGYGDYNLVPTDCKKVDTVTTLVAEIRKSL